MTKSAVFVLIHGAFRGGFSFLRLRPLLEAHGHKTYAPSLPGCGEHAHASRKELSLHDWATCVSRLLALEDLHEVILVGHSQAGIVISAASQLCSERIGRLVFLDAPIPVHGERAVDLVPAALSGMNPPPLARDMWIPAKPLVASETLSAEDAAFINARTSPTPLGPSLDPLVLSEARALALPRHYLFCTKTPNTYPCAHGRERLEKSQTPYTWIEGDHDAIFTAPKAVAEVLLAIARGDAKPHT